MEISFRLNFFPQAFPNDDVTKDVHSFSASAEAGLSEKKKFLLILLLLQFLGREIPNWKFGKPAKDAVQLGKSGGKVLLNFPTLSRQFSETSFLASSNRNRFWKLIFEQIVQS